MNTEKTIYTWQSNANFKEVFKLICTTSICASTEIDQAWIDSFLSCYVHSCLQWCRWGFHICSLWCIFLHLHIHQLLRIDSPRHEWESLIPSTLLIRGEKVWPVKQLFEWVHEGLVETKTIFFHYLHGWPTVESAFEALLCAQSAEHLVCYSTALRDPARYKPRGLMLEISSSVLGILPEISTTR